MALPLKTLPLVIGLLRQECGSGEITLEQNDGLRRLFFSRGELTHLTSDVAGERFGSLLHRLGILDLSALNGILAYDEPYPIGEKVIQFGLMTLQERDAHLQTLNEQIMVNALEHRVLQCSWHPLPQGPGPAQERPFKLTHRAFIWKTFAAANYLSDLLATLEAETTWRWVGQPGLLDSLRDLPLTPNSAYALSFLGADPISFDTFRSLSSLDSEAAGHLIATLWALGTLALAGCELPRIGEPAPEPPAPLPPLDPPGFLDQAPPEMEFLDSEPEEAHSYPHAAAYEDPPLDPPPLRQAPPPLPRQDPFSVPDSGLPAKPPPPPASLQRQDPFSRPDPFARPAAPPVAPPPPAPPRYSPDAFTQPETIQLAAPFGQAPALPLAPGPPLQGAARARSLFLLAKQQVSRDRTVEAIRSLEQALQLELDPLQAYDAWLLLGQLRMANPAWSTRSIDALQHASILRPRAVEPWVAMGELYHRKGFAANAAACYHQALERNPSLVIPPDVDMEASDPPEAPVTQGKKAGFLGKVRKIMGGTKQT